MNPGLACTKITVCCGQTALKPARANSNPFHNRADLINQEPESTLFVFPPPPKKVFFYPQLLAAKAAGGACGTTVPRLFPGCAGGWAEIVSVSTNQNRGRSKRRAASGAASARRPCTSRGSSNPKQETPPLELDCDPYLAVQFSTAPTVDRSPAQARPLLQSGFGSPGWLGEIPPII